MMRLQSGHIAAICLGFALAGAALSGAQPGYYRATTLPPQSGVSAPTQQPATDNSSDRVRKRLRQHIRQLELRHARALSSVFAFSKTEAERKIIDKLKEAPEFKPSEEPVSVGAFGFCDTTLTESEKETLAKNLVHLSRPEIFTLTLTSAYTTEDDHIRQRLVDEEAHRIIQATLGDVRYRAAYEQCSARNTEDSKMIQRRSNEIFYRFLGLTANQQNLISAILEEAASRLNPSNSVPNLLDQNGRLPSSAEAENSPPAGDDTAQQQASSESELIQAEFQKKVQAILSPMQLALARKYRSEILMGIGGPLLWELLGLDDDYEETLPESEPSSSVTATP